MQKMWVWVEEMQMHSDELKKKLLLVRDQYGCIAWHQAAETGSLEALEILWIWAKKVRLSTDELLLAQSRYGESALHMAAKGNHGVMLQKMWVWVEEMHVNSNELKKKLLLARDQYGYTA